MAEINGKTVLCSGCPVTGEFVGEVEPSKLNFFLSEDHYGQPAAAAVFTDEYDMQSKVVYGTRFSDRDKAKAEINLEILKSGAAESICDRVSKCVGHTATFSANSRYSQELRRCPAINKTVLDHLSHEG